MTTQADTDRSEYQRRCEEALKVARLAAAQTKGLGAKTRPISALLAARVAFIKIVGILEDGRS